MQSAYANCREDEHRLTASSLLVLLVVEDKNIGDRHKRSTGKQDSVLRVLSPTPISETRPCNTTDSFATSRPLLLLGV